MTSRLYRVEVGTRSEFPDARGQSLCRQAAALGVGGVSAISVSTLYFLEGELDDPTVCRLADTLLHDPVVEQVEFQMWSEEQGANASASHPNASFIEVAPLPGVTDSVAESLLSSARMIGVTGLARAATGHRYAIAGDTSHAELRRIAEGLLANIVIQAYTIDRPVPPPFVPVQAADDTVDIIPLSGAGDAELEAISRERRLSLDLAEMQAIRDYYRRDGREPTDVELEMLAQTWSEHCIHKTFKAIVDYEEVGPDGTPVPGSRRTVDSILKTSIRAATEKVNKPWVRSAFVDNAGIVAFDDRFDLAFKVETHNHPSALEPFGGANTGVGGVIRDVIGVSAWPIANTDVLCFGPLDLPFEALPTGILHPRRISDGVTAGIEDYGNKMGIPTVNGAILYDEGYTANPLVFCGCLGLLPHGVHRSTPQQGDLVVVIGGRTGRDGLRGATFSSMEMNHETGQVAGSAVQIGHPIREKQALEAVMLARDEGLYDAITDCGAGGLSSAVGEMASDLGAVVHLERVPLKYAGLRPWEIWLSEAQERMVLAVPEEKWQRLRAICDGLDVEATALGQFTGDGRLTLRYNGRTVGEMDTGFLHNGILRRRLRAIWTRPGQEPGDVGAASEPGDVGAASAVFRTGTSPPAGLEPSGGADRLKPLLQGRTGTLLKSGLEQPRSLTEVLLALLALPDTRSKEDIVRRYDHEVQGATIVKPFVGRANAGPSDAAVLDLRFRTGSDQPSAISDQPSAISYQPLAISYQPSAISYPPSAINHPPSAIRHPPSAISHQPSAIRHQPSAISYQPPYAGVALAVGINPAYGVIDPYAMAWAAVDEAVRNCVAVGADPDRISLLDNFCWGNPNLPDRLGSLVRCAQGCHDAAVAYGAPFISGKDSLNNEYTGADGVKHAIPGTLLISAVGIVPDVGCTVTTGLQAAGDLLYVLGITGDELGGSAYHRLMADTCTCTGAQRRCKCDPFVVRASARWLPGLTGGIVPQPPAHALAIYRALHSAMRRGLVRACHDCSEGGLGVAAAEMVLGGGLGLELNLAAVPRAPGFDRTDALLFGESLGRLLVEVEPGHAAEFETLLAGLPCAPIGNVTADGRLRVLGPAGEAVVEADCAALDAAWRGHLR